MAQIHGVPVTRLQEVQPVAIRNPYAGHVLGDVTLLYGSAKNVMDFISAHPTSSLNGNARAVKADLEDRLAVFQTGFDQLRHSGQIQEADAKYFDRCYSAIHEYKAALVKHLQRVRN